MRIEALHTQSIAPAQQLRTGETVRARIAGVSGPETLIEVRGQVFSARLPAGINAPDGLLLRFEGMREGRAVFSLIPPAAAAFPGLTASAFASLFARGAGPLEVLARTSGAKSPQERAGIMQELASRAKGSGMSSADTAALSRVIDSLAGGFPLEEFLPPLDSPVREEILDQFAPLAYAYAAADEDGGVFYIDDEGEPSPVSYLAADAMLAVEFSLSTAGRIGVLGRMTEKYISVMLAVERDAFREALAVSLPALRSAAGGGARSVQVTLSPAPTLAALFPEERGGIRA